MIPGPNISVHPNPDGTLTVSDGNITVQAVNIGEALHELERRRAANSNSTALPPKPVEQPGRVTSSPSAPARFFDAWTVYRDSRWRA